MGARLAEALVTALDVVTVVVGLVWHHGLLTRRVRAPTELSYSTASAFTGYHQWSARGDSACVPLARTSCNTRPGQARPFRRSRAWIAHRWGSQWRRSLAVPLWEVADGFAHRLAFRSALMAALTATPVHGRRVKSRVVV